MSREHTGDEAEFREVLTGEHGGLSSIRNAMKRVPASPRCKLCAAPFSGVGGAVLRHFGYARFAGNPSLCIKCIREFRKAGTFGAEIPVTLLFADVRGSTSIGERLRPADFRAYLDHFYRTGTRGEPRSFYRPDVERLTPLAIPRFTPQRFESRFAF